MRDKENEMEKLLSFSLSSYRQVLIKCNYAVKILLLVYENVHHPMKCANMVPENKRIVLIKIYHFVITTTIKYFDCFELQTSTKYSPEQY